MFLGPVPHAERVPESMACSEQNGTNETVSMRPGPVLGPVQIVWRTDAVSLSEPARTGTLLMMIEPIGLL